MKKSINSISEALLTCNQLLGAEIYPNRGTEEIDDIFDGNIVWADADWLLIHSKHGLEKIEIKNFFTENQIHVRSFLPGMNICFIKTKISETENFCTLSESGFERELAPAKLRLFVMQELGVTAAHQLNDPLENFHTEQGSGTIKFSDRFKDDDDNFVVHISHLENFNSGNGFGNHIMNTICLGADNMGLTLHLKPSPIKEKTISLEKLINFYERFGFSKGKREYFIRRPKTSTP